MVSFSQYWVANKYSNLVFHLSVPVYMSLFVWFCVSAFRVSIGHVAWALCIVLQFTSNNKASEYLNEYTLCLWPASASS